MAVTTLMTIAVGTITYTFVDNDSTKDYAQTQNPLRFSVTKNGVTLSRKFPSFKLGVRHFSGIVMNSSMNQSIAAQPRHYAGVS